MSVGSEAVVLFQSYHVKGVWTFKGRSFSPVVTPLRLRCENLVWIDCCDPLALGFEPGSSSLENFY